MTEQQKQQQKKKKMNKKLNESSLCEFFYPMPPWVCH